MHSISRLVAVVAGLVLLLNSTPSWGQPVCAAPGCNPTLSDANNNTAGGTAALGSLGVEANRNTAFGKSALSSTLGSSNTAIGSKALQSNTTGLGNTASGSDALLSNTTGDINTAFGVEALQNNTTGVANSACGADALQLNTTGSRNTATGAAALQINTTGNHNTATGLEALLLNTTGNNNTASGSTALFSNDTGNLNTATGFQALESNSAGNNNTAIGAKALKKALGTKNIAIGFQAGVSLITGNNNIYIGNQGAGDEFQTIRIGTAQSQTFIAGINGAIVSGTTVEIDTTTGQLGVVPSSARYKQNIAPMGPQSEKMLQLQPVTFAYKDDSNGTTHYGLIAEEVAAAYPELVTRTATGEVQAVRYQELIPMLLNELQRQRREFQQELAALRALVEQGRRAEAVMSQTIRIGTAQSSTFIAGINGASVSDATVMIDTVTGQLGIATSSARYKQDIAPMGNQSEKMLQLQPVTFAYKDDSKGTIHYGLIAEEVAAVYPELVTHTATGEVQAVRYQELIPMLLNELQRERQDLRQALQMLQHQQRELSDLRALVEQRRGAEAVVPSAMVAVGGTGSMPR